MAHAREHPMVGVEDVIESRQIGVIGLLPHVGKVKIIRAVAGSGLIGQRIVIREIQSDRAQQTFRKNVSGEGRALIKPSGGRLRRVGVVNLILASQTEQSGKISDAFGRCGDGAGLVGRRGLSEQIFLPREEPECAIAS